MGELTPDPDKHFVHKIQPGRWDELDRTRGAASGEGDAGVRITRVTDLDITPEQASRGSAVPDADLPMLAALWLVRGYDSPLLRELAGVDQVDTTHSPYASAQRVLEVLQDVPDLWEPGGGRQLMTLLERWDEERHRRDELTEHIRIHLRSLRASDVPPLT